MDRQTDRQMPTVEDSESRDETATDNSHTVTAGQCSMGRTEHTDTHTHKDIRTQTDRQTNRQTDEHHGNCQ